MVNEDVPKTKPLGHFYAPYSSPIMTQAIYHVLIGDPDYIEIAETTDLLTKEYLGPLSEVRPQNKHPESDRAQG